MNRIHLVERDMVHRPKELGGMGLRQMKHLNLASLSKLADVF